jgi:transglutaminase-like putative cysteine protease
MAELALEPLPLSPLDLVLGPGASLDELLARQIQFLPWRGLDWSAVRRTRFFAYQRFSYRYPRPIRDLHQQLMVMPPVRYGDQRLLDVKISVEPLPLFDSVRQDDWGNWQHEFDLSRAEDWTEFEVMFSVERQTEPEGRFAGASITEREAALFRAPTRLTEAEGRIGEVADDLRRRARSQFEFAQRVSDWVSNAMQYGSGHTNVATTAAEALEVGRGLCQDYAHIAIAVLRAAGVAARYVSGHMLGEGASHAWLEAVVPSRLGMPRLLALDPTNARVPNLGYTVVARGRDYRDVPPTSGYYTGSHSGVLDYEKHAGLVLIEWADGRVDVAAHHPTQPETHHETHHETAPAVHTDLSERA